MREIRDTTTEIVWDYELNNFRCTKCGALMHYVMEKKRCPYCKRLIVFSDDHRIEV